jgi:imidazolonepropionase-like amidohydrolase
MRICAAMLLVLLAAGPALSQADDVALTGAKIYLSPDQAPIENGTILVRNGKVQAVGPAGSAPIPPGAKRIDCRSLTITAGFWNSHVHMLTPTLLRAKEASVADLDAEMDKMFNRWGFTTVFDIASILDNTLALRHRVETGEVRGPRILTTGEPVWTIEPVYVRAFLGDNHLSIPNTKTPEEAIALVRDHIKKGVDGIKLFTGSYQGGDNVANLPLPVAQAAVKEAHAHGLPVFHASAELQGSGDRD